MSAELRHSILESFRKDEDLFRFIRNKMYAIGVISDELEIEVPYIQSDLEKHISDEIKVMLTLLLEAVPHDIRQCRRRVSDI